MSDKYNINAPQQRACKVLGTLAGHEEDGLAQGQVAEALGVSSSRMHHDLRNLERAGLVERLDSGRWRLGPKLVQIARAYADGLSRMKSRVDEIEQRYSRLPK